MFWSCFLVEHQSNQRSVVCFIAVDYCDVTAILQETAAGVYMLVSSLRGRDERIKTACRILAFSLASFSFDKSNDGVGSAMPASSPFPTETSQRCIRSYLTPSSKKHVRLPSCCWVWERWNSGSLVLSHQHHPSSQEASNASLSCSGVSLLYLSKMWEREVRCALVDLTLPSQTCLRWPGLHANLVWSAACLHTSLVWGTNIFFRGRGCWRLLR